MVAQKLKEQWSVSKNILNGDEMEELVRLFDDIKLDLTVTDFPTRTNRLEAVENMKKVLEIHGYKLTREEV